MQRISVPASKVKETLRAVVAERPDYVYELPAHMVGTTLDGVPVTEGSCLYVHTAEDGTRSPGCLVGHVLARLGAPLEKFEPLEGTGACNVVPVFLDITGEPDDVREAELELVYAQCEQDGEATWADALEVATRKPGE
ncbi:hypothetical protein AB0958_21900 [Streptomyces sp. NPDC006655]|uniref:hypothetical protein n=1 Tax=Streptomyces sp. NPDC006655 TaxID=3156898 RepID=UPI003455BC22